MSPIDTAVEKISHLEKIPENHLTSSIMMSNLIPQKIISHLKEKQLISMISMIQLTYLVMTSNLIPQKKISRLKKNPMISLMSMTQLISLVTMVNLIQQKKISGLEIIPVTSLMSMIQLTSLVNVKPDHNLKILSTHATDNVDNPGKNQSKTKYS